MNPGKRRKFGTTATGPASAEPSRQRGRPRSELARQAILKAAAALIEKGGLGAVTMEAVARDAGVGKPTIYRSWPNREALAMAALLAGPSLNTEVRKTVSALDDLEAQLQKVIKVFANPRGRNAALMVASSDGDTELAKAFRNQVMLASREAGRALIERAITAGDVAAGVPVDVVLDMIYGALFYRLLMGHAKIDDGLPAQLIAAVIDRK
jgi:AcrR family transcriptional regulator